MGYLLKIYFFCVLSTTVMAQSVSIGGGYRPNRAPGNHFNASVEQQWRGRFVFAAHYQMIKYTDFFQNARRPQPSLHKEYKEDETILPFPELDRGVHLQRGDPEFRPRDFYHHFGLLVGYQVLEWRDFNLVAFGGPHFSLNRSYYYNWEVPITIASYYRPDTGEEVPVQYHDYQIYRTWDLGLTARADLRYALFENLAVGVHYIWSADLLGGGWDLAWGGTVAFNFGTHE